ncbi:MAG: anti-sigma factor [Desulfomonilaceae bacterium]
MKKCSDFCKKLSDYLDRELSEAECKLIEDHLRQCPPCAIIFQGLERTVSLCGKGISDEVPPAVKQRLINFLRNRCCNDYVNK